MQVDFSAKFDVFCCERLTHTFWEPMEEGVNDLSRGWVFELTLQDLITSRNVRYGWGPYGVLRVSTWQPAGTRSGGTCSVAATHCNPYLSFKKTVKFRIGSYRLVDQLFHRMNAGTSIIPTLVAACFARRKSLADKSFTERSIDAGLA